VTEQRDPTQRVLSWLLLILVAYRLAYHASYLGEVPFAHATFSDGAIYEQSARDILEHPPLGSQAFYLQGAYAYLLALGMVIRPWPSLGLIVQLLLAFATLWLFHRSARQLWGVRAGQLATLVLLAHPALAFYENKYLSAELAVATGVLTLAGFVALLRAASTRARLLACGLLGFASGAAILARPNMLLAVPFTLLAIGLLARPLKGRGVLLAGKLAATSLGLLLALAPMAARNLAVTGHPDIQPIHGGGTSFFIGNNPKSKGVWNDAGLLTADLGTERAELARALAIDAQLSERDQARAIGDELYRRAFAWIREHPGDFAELELRKLWLLLGDQQLTQDYDWLGERELLPWAHRVGVSFSLLLALGLLGGWSVFRARDPRPADEAQAPEPRWTGPDAAALACFLLGQLAGPVAANLLFFTSAQHRLPLVIPLTLLAGPGLAALIEFVRSRAWPVPIWLSAVLVLVLVQGPWPRTHQTAPHPVHYYNLAMVEDSIGEPVLALHSLNRAIELRPEQALFHMRRAHLLVRLADLDGAERDLDLIARLAQQREVPSWVLQQAELDRRTIAHERALQAAGLSR
jgi:hypothetical protein